MPHRRSQSILFLCIGNSCRSQIAEGFARAYAPHGVNIYSAGTSPYFVHPLTIRVMAEKGVDISRQWSKGLDDVPLNKIDTVVTLFEESDDACPSFPERIRHLHWPVQDPIRAVGDDKRVLSVFRTVRDDIEARVKEFFARHHS